LLSCALVFAAACDSCADSPAPGAPCSTNADCEGDLRCIDGTCISPDVDAGPPRRDAGECTDMDGDGRGVGCAAGPDCDDTNPRRGGGEVCDEIDNDCDGAMDEGFAGVCVECTPQCTPSEHPGAGGWMPTPENSESVIVDPEGALTLGRTMTESFSVWVANQDDGTVSKLDSRTNTEIARYTTTRPDAVNRARPWNEACNWSDRGNCPSRTAVDQNFDAYVANRAFGNMGTVTKYANEEADCIDRNANGVIDTSRDLNGDGTIQTDGAEFVGPDDECLLWTVPVGVLDGAGEPQSNGVPRALAIGIAPPDGGVGTVWVGLHRGRAACQLDPMDGHVFTCIDLAGHQPYGAVADSLGRIWFADRSGSRRELAGYVDSATMTWHLGEPVPASSCATGSLQSYGITTDGDGKIYVASSNCEPGLLRYDPAAMVWDTYSIPGGGTPRGVAADETHLWVGISHNSIGFGGGWANRVEQYRLSDMTHVMSWSIPDGRGPVGVGVSFDGSIWAVNQGSNSASRLDPATGTWIEHPVGLTPYTYSDFIGYGLNVFADPRGRYRFPVEGCESGETRWQALSYRAEVPAMTRVEIWARTSDTRDGLAAETWVGPFTENPANLLEAPGPLPARRWLEVELRLFTDDRSVAPRIFDLDLGMSCGAFLG
jgi:streptogramin lyase